MRLARARIGGDLSCNGGSFANPDLHGLNLDGASVAGLFFDVTCPSATQRESIWRMLRWARWSMMKRLGRHLTLSVWRGSRTRTWLVRTVNPINGSSGFDAIRTTRRSRMNNSLRCTANTVKTRT